MSKTTTPDPFDPKALATVISEALADPEPVMKWIEGLEQTQRTGRIKRAKQAPMVYGIERFLQQRIRTVYDQSVQPVYVMDIGESDIYLAVMTGKGEPEELEVSHPDWLRLFFEVHPEHLDESDETEIMEVLQRVFEAGIFPSRFGEEAHS